MEQERGLIGPIGLVGVTLCWGSTPVILRYLTDTVDGWTANGIRYPFVALLYLPIILWGFRRGSLNKKIVLACLVPAVFSLGGQVMWGLAPYYLEAKAMGFFVRLSMIFSTCGAMVLFADERELLRKPIFYVGLVMTVIGFLSFAYFGGYFSASVSLTGVVMMILCSFFFGMYAVSVRYWLRDVSPLFSFAVVSQFVSVGTLGLMFGMGDYGQLKDVGATGWTLLLASAIMGIALGHVFLFAAVQSFGPSIATSVQTVTPFVTVLVGSYFLGEKMLPLQWPGGISMALGALMLVQARPKRTREQKIEQADDDTADADD